MMMPRLSGHEAKAEKATGPSPTVDVWPEVQSSPPFRGREASQVWNFGMAVGKREVRKLDSSLER